MTDHTNHFNTHRKWFVISRHRYIWGRGRAGRETLSFLFSVEHVSSYPRVLYHATLRWIDFAEWRSLKGSRRTQVVGCWTYVTLGHCRAMLSLTKGHHSFAGLCTTIKFSGRDFLQSKSPNRPKGNSNRSCLQVAVVWMIRFKNHFCHWAGHQSDVGNKVD